MLLYVIQASHMKKACFLCQTHRVNKAGQRKSQKKKRDPITMSHAYTPAPTLKLSVEAGKSNHTTNKTILPETEF